jgi:hypothetical protein
MDDVTMALPIRLVPRKGGAIFRAIFFLFFGGFAVFWIATAASMMGSGQVEGEPFQGFRYLFPAFGLPFFAVGLIGFLSSLAKLLPGSPYYHVEIAADGITVRKGWKTRRFAWPALSPFGISVKVSRGKNGTTTTYWVVALRAGDAERLAFESERYNRSVLQIDAGEYCAGDAEHGAPVLVDWLNGIRAEAIERPGHATGAIAVPPDFRDNARALHPAPAAGVQVATPRRSSVIER